MHLKCVATEYWQPTSATTPPLNVIESCIINFQIEQFKLIAPQNDRPFCLFPFSVTWHILHKM